MARRIFIWVGHPRKISLCTSLADAYQAGAEAAGLEVRRMDLADMTLERGDPALIGRPEDKPGADLEAWQAAIAWADHVLFVHPYWWAGMPAEAKAVFDRGLSSGFAYRYTGEGASWDKLLADRTGDAIITSDTPPLIDRFFYGRPGRRVMKNQVLKFCGIRPRKILQFGSVKLASEKTRAGWIKRAEKLGASLA